MERARFVRTSSLLLTLGLAGLGGGCGSGHAPSPLTKEEDAKIREDMRSVHQQIREDAKRARKGGNSPGGMMKAAHSKNAGH